MKLRKMLVAALWPLWLCGAEQDFNYFATLVQPVLLKSCAGCHNHAKKGVGKFLLPAAGASDETGARANFAAMHAVVNEAHPERSLLLRKPLKGNKHKGGAQWPDTNALPYQVVSAWLQGSRLEKAYYQAPSFAAFVANVQPIFTRPGADGMACVNCHVVRSVLHLIPPSDAPPDEAKPYTFEQLKSNYEATLRVIDLEAPENSYLLRKPTSPREASNPASLSHTGGVRWPSGLESAEYRTILSWLRRQ